MNASLFHLLYCPVCHAALSSQEGERSCHCSGVRSHCFDFSRSGYLNLAGTHAGEGDGKEAILSRRAFLEAGYYQVLADEVVRILDTVSSKTVLDAGCGEGYYTNRMASPGREVLGVDLSRSGIDYAARRAKQNATGVGFAVASVFDIPSPDASFDVVTNLFAPCAEAEYDRVLRPGGSLLLVGAGERHLMGLKRALYDDPYINPGRADLPQNMKLVERRRLQSEITVKGHEMIEALFSMTPYYWRTSQRDRAKLEGLECLPTELDFDIFLFRKGL